MVNRYPDGKGCSMQLNGVNQYAVVNNLLPDLTSNTVSVSIWVKTTSTTWNAYGWILSARATINGRDFVIHPNPGGQVVSVYYGNASTWFGTANITPSDITKWHQYGFTYDGKYFIAYLDGQIIAKTNVGPQTLSIENIPVYIGSDSLIGGRYGNGWIDNVQIFNKSLTARDMETLYAEGKRNTNIADANNR